MRPVHININLNYCIILFLVFAVLKVANVVSWSWWWVTSPLWIPVVLFGAVALVVFVLVFFGVFD